ncbi:hypothetical protein J2S43_002974 [Catenuloplanes nepalensis]|uniref:Uncharacterized protein n=1 Tax=Catenuloplanes nepalensis TaxID=587533 RepID=A0ABT9MSQ7_9ACTN|nr:hypothetical protein [Catenuloplanes nepalensis]MDP9794462.1 hypothetical protein [Catenuloplanes nepalensis]
MGSPEEVAAFPGAPVVPWPRGEPAPRPPDGAAGISVWVRNRAGDPLYWGHKHVVGISDRPVFWGIGRMVAFVGPGEHRAEVRYLGVVSSARTVRVRSGEIAQLEFWTPAATGTTTHGVLAPAPSHYRTGARSPGTTAVVAVVIALMAVTLLLARQQAVGAAMPRPVTSVLAGAAIARAANEACDIPRGTGAAGWRPPSSVPDDQEA